MAENDSPPPIPPKNPSDPELQGLDPAQLLARGLNTVRFSGTFGDWAPPAPEDLARLLPQYHIEAMLGHGGMGAVYKGFQRDLDRPVAIKLLPAELSADEQFVSRFKREARTLAKLHHPGIVAVYDFGQTSEGHLYFVMEYVDGTDLRRVLKGPGLNPQQALELVGQICEALQAAHRQGVIHRDIKPANILLTSDGSVKLADFGLSRPVREEEDTGALTGSHMVMGTADYMSPEQRTGHSDHRTDIYALGVTLYEMLTGKCPRGVFVPPSRKVQIDVRIDEVVIKALQEEPDLRYQQASEMKSDVDHIRTSKIEAVPPSAPPAPRSRSMRRALGAVALLVLIAAICWVVASLSSDQPETPKPVAVQPVAANRPTIPAAVEPSPAKPAATPETSAAPSAIAEKTPASQNAAPSKSAAQQNPTSAEQALTSYPWAVAVDSGNPATVLYYADGTGRGPRPYSEEHWVATGERTVNLNGDTPCVFDETFSKFIGSWTDSQNRRHTTTGVRLAGGVIRLVSATYGCGPPYRVDITAKVLSMLQAGQRQIRASNDLSGGIDLLRGKVKALIVHLSCDCGQFQIGTREGETLTIPDALPPPTRSQPPIGTTADSPPAPPSAAAVALSPETARESGSPQPAGIKDALVSSWWKIKSDDGESKILFLPDGTTQGSGPGAWVATGPLAFTINGKVSCVFDQSYVGFIGHFTDSRGAHRVTGTRIGLAAGPALASLQQALTSYSWSWVNIQPASGVWTELRFNPDGTMTAWAGDRIDYTGRWEIESPHVVEFQWGSTDFTLTFDEAFSRFDARRGNLPGSQMAGARKAAVSRVPAIAKVEAPAPATQPELYGTARAAPAPAAGQDPVIGLWRWAGAKSILTLHPDGTATDRRHGRWVRVTPADAPPTYQIHWGLHLDTLSLVNNGTELAGQNEVNFKLHLVRVAPAPSPPPSAPMNAGTAAVAGGVIPQIAPLQQTPFPTPVAMPTPGAMPPPLSDEPPVRVSASGPAGTNFGWGGRDLKLDVSVTSNSPAPIPVTIDCYWVGFDGRAHTTALSEHRDASVSGAQPLSFEVNTQALRTNGVTRGILGSGIPKGPYRGWIVTVHDKDGTRLACSSNMPEFQHLVP